MSKNIDLPNLGGRVSNHSLPGISNSFLKNRVLSTNSRLLSRMIGQLAFSSGKFQYLFAVDAGADDIGLVSLLSDAL